MNPRRIAVAVAPLVATPAAADTASWTKNHNHHCPTTRNRLASRLSTSLNKHHDVANDSNANLLSRLYKRRPGRVFTSFAFAAAATTTTRGGAATKNSSNSNSSSKNSRDKSYSIQLMITRRSPISWWILPLLVMLVSYFTFPNVSRTFHRLVIWASDDSWFADTVEKTNLQSNVITQVVNGPVVTSISVLFATLISVTISTLHSRQQDVQSSLINEIAALRTLDSLLSNSPLYDRYVTYSEKIAILERIKVLRTVVTTESNTAHSRPQRQSNPHEYIELKSNNLLLLCDQIETLYLNNPRQRPQDPRPLLDKIRSLIDAVRLERKHRWIAVTSMHFPMAHYMTLALLVTSILIAFLVTTDEAEFIFLSGLQVRMLWSVLVTCFSSLAVVCADLTDAFSGNYAVTTEFP